MNASATKKIAFAALVAPALATVALGLAGAASADATPDGVPSAQDTVTQMKDQGFRVIVNTNNSTPLNQCTVISTRQDHRHHGADHGDLAVYIDAICPPAE